MKRVSLFATLGVVSSLALVPAVGALAATTGAHAAGPAIYHGTATHVTRLAHFTGGLSALPKLKSALKANTASAVTQFRSPAGSFPARRATGLRAAKVSASTPAATAYTSGSTGASVVHHFNGISDADQAALNPGEVPPNPPAVTPPDQGLCVGHVAGIFGNHNFLIQMVNVAARVTNTNGAQLQPDVSLPTLFQDPNAFSDPRCVYDSATHTFFFTVISFPPGGPNPSLTNTVNDVAVLNSHGFSVYQFDSSSDGTSTGQCLGDQQKVGFDNNVLILSTDQFCGPTLSVFEGALVVAVSKSQLVNQDLNPGVNQFGPVALAGIPVTGLDPAIGTGTGNEYLVNSFPFDEFGNINAVSSSLGLWKLEHESAVTTGSGTAELTGKLIGSETYAFPVPAESTGDGSVTGDVTSEAFLNPDDSRLSGPVEVSHANGAVQLWTALDSAVAVKGDPTGRDGAAWFRIDTSKQKVVSQGFVGTKGAYLLYPAMAPRSGGAAMVFTITSATIDPAAAFTTLGSNKIKIVAAGAGPHLSFAEVDFGQFRWGDYSFVAPDSSGNIWMATEYIPPVQFQDPEDNWGTFVVAVH
jgi:hypothetical protein